MTKVFLNPQDIAQEGQKIYQQKYAADYETKFSGKFVAINVVTGEAYVDDLPEAAIAKGQAVSGDGIFHLMKVGSSGAFRVSYSSNPARDSWLFR